MRRDQTQSAHARQTFFPASRIQAMIGFFLSYFHRSASNIAPSAHKLSHGISGLLLYTGIYYLYIPQYMDMPPHVGFVPISQAILSAIIRRFTIGYSTLPATVPLVSSGCTDCGLQVLPPNLRGREYYFPLLKLPDEPCLYLTGGNALGQ